MERWAKRLASVATVKTLDYPYMLSGRRAPDPLPRLIAAHRDALAQARANHDGPVVLAGKSMGGRIGCHVALEEPVSGLVCFGYPLKGAGKAAKVRDAVLVDLRTPVLFLQGTRDSLCPLDLLESVRSRMTARNELMIVEGGDHSLEVTVSRLREAGETQESTEELIFTRISGFLQTLA
jgi:predicted alpha/beta-hydrolase family hydrolase